MGDMRQLPPRDCGARRILLHLLNRKILLAALLLLPIFWSSERLMPTTAAPRDIITSNAALDRPNDGQIIIFEFCLFTCYASESHCSDVFALAKESCETLGTTSTCTFAKHDELKAKHTKTHWKRAAKGRLLLGKKYFWFWKFSTKL